MKLTLKQKVITIILTLSVCVSANVMINKNASASDEAVLLKEMTFDGSDNAYTINGGKIVIGADGKNAIRLKNKVNESASEYIDMGAFDIKNQSFSISFWCRTQQVQIEGGSYCALISNKDWSKVINSGFMIATSNESGTFKGFWVDFSATGNNERYRLRNMPETDGNWHSVSVVFDRKKQSVGYYLDGNFCSSMDISGITTESATAGNIFVGCDANKKYGCIDSSFDEIKIYSGALSEQKIKENADKLLSYTSYISLKQTFSKYLSYNLIDKSKADEYYNGLKEIDKLKENITAENASEIVNKIEELNSVVFSTNGKKITSFNLMSDIHIDGAPSDQYPETLVYENKLKNAFRAFVSLFKDTETLLIPGDFTKNGKTIDYDKFFKMLRTYNLCDNVILSLGNHEVKNIAMSDVRKYFLNGLSSVGTTVDDVYYDRWIDGYHFIALSTEDIGDKNKAVISDAQLSWLRSRLAEKAQNGKPIFLLLHQPLKGTFALSDQYPVGEADEKIKEILKDYPQTILISGHLHNGYLDDRALISNEYGYQFDCSSLWQNDLANQSGNYVYHADVYSDRIEILTVNVATMKIEYKYTKIIPLSKIGAEFSGDRLETTLYTSDMTEIEGGTCTIESEYGVSHSVILALDEVRRVHAVTYKPSGDETGRILDYAVEYSVDGVNWKGVQNGSGVFSGDESVKTAVFPEVSAKYVKFISLRTTNMTAKKFVTKIDGIGLAGV